MEPPFYRNAGSQPDAVRVMNKALPLSPSYGLTPVFGPAGVRAGRAFFWVGL